MCIGRPFGVLTQPEPRVVPVAPRTTVEDGQHCKHCGLTRLPEELSTDRIDPRSHAIGRKIHQRLLD